MLGGNLGNFNISLMVPIEVPIQKYSSGPQHYNPVWDFFLTAGVKVCVLVTPPPQSWQWLRLEV